PKSDPGVCQTTCAPPKKPVRDSVSSTSPEKFAMLTPATGPNSNDCAAASSAAANVAAMTASAYSLRIVTSFSVPHGVVVRGYGHTSTGTVPRSVSPGRGNFRSHAGIAGPRSATKIHVRTNSAMAVEVALVTRFLRLTTPAAQCGDRRPPRTGTRQPPTLTVPCYAARLTTQAELLFQAWKTLTTRRVRAGSPPDGCATPAPRSGRGSHRPGERHTGA